METCQRVLIIDPAPAIDQLIRRHLEGERVSLHSAATAEAGLAMAARIQPDLILLDLDLPDEDAFEVLKRLKADPATMEAPVVLLAAPGAQVLKMRGLDLGAFDYVHKPFDPAELRARVRSGLRMHFLARMLSARSMIDGVTGLRNRDYFEQRLHQEMSLAIRSGHPCSCVLLDIDGFGKINQTWGHRIGDEVLKQAAAILVNTCRAEDLLCRHGGGQFIVLAPNTPAERIVHLAQRMRAKLEAAPIAVRGGTIRVTASFGVADVLRDGPEATLAAVRAALDRAKAAGGNRVESAEPPGRAKSCAA